MPEVVHTEDPKYDSKSVVTAMPEVVNTEDPKHDSKSEMAVDAMTEVVHTEDHKENSSSPDEIEVYQSVIFLILLGFIIYAGFSSMLNLSESGAKEDLVDFNIGIYINTGVLGLTSEDSEYWLYFFDVNDIIKYDNITTKVTTDPRFLRIQNFFTWRRNDSDTCYRLIGKSGAVLTEDKDCFLLNGTEFYYHFNNIFTYDFRRGIFDCKIQYEAFQTSNASSNTSLHYGRFRYFREYTGEYSGLDVLAIDAWITWNKLVDGCEDEIYIQRLFSYDEYHVRFPGSYGRYRFRLADDLYDVDIKQAHWCLRDVPMPKGSTSYRIKSPPFCLILSLSLCTYYFGWILTGLHLYWIQRAIRFGLF